MKVEEIERDRFGVMYSGELGVGECIEVVAVNGLGFTDLMWIAQRLLDEHYPHDVMAAMPDDPGPKLTLALRECMEAMRRCPS